MIPRKRRIKKAKYNGVSFYIEDDETSGGRRIVTHEFPYSEIPATEDLGKKAKQWQIQGFVGGALYKQEAEKLQDALEQAGVGTLDHPYIGKNKKVRCTSYRRNETNREWGVVWFSMTLTEAGELPQITALSIADQAQKTQSFLENVLHTSQSIALGASGVLSGAADTLDSLSEQLEENLAPFIAVRESLGDVLTSLAGLKNVGRDILSEPGNYLNAFIGALGVLIESPLDSLTLMNILSSSLTPLFESINPSLERTELHSTSETLATVMLIYMSEVATRNDILNTKAREKIKTLFLSSCDLCLDQSDSFFEIIQNVRSETYFTLQKQDEQRNVKIIHPQGCTNILLLAYELYGDVSKSIQLTQMNPDLNPCFIISRTPSSP